MSMFAPLERRQSRARVAIQGVSGSGKTFGALTLARLFGSRIAAVDSERGSLAKCKAAFDGGRPVADGRVLEEKNIQEYLDTVQGAALEGYEVLLLDSYSHSWIGALEQVDRIGGNRFTGGWKVVSPLVTKLVDAILSYPGHVIVTMRSKSDWVIEQNDRGKAVPRKIGLAAVAREGHEYEWDVVLDLDTAGVIQVTKSRCPGLHEGLILNRGAAATDEIGDWPKIADALKAWLSLGAPPSPRALALERIQFAPTSEGLASAAAWIRDEKTAGRLALTPEDLAAVKAAFLARKAALAGPVADAEGLP